MRRCCLILVFALLSGTSAVAQESESAKSLDKLLDLVKEGRAREQREQREREAQFRAARDEQKQLLADARKRQAAAERQSEQLERTYDANELKIVEVTEQRDRRLGSLKELFGVLQQVTGDTQGLLESSVTNAQFPDRTDFLVQLNGTLASSSTLPSIEEIEHLWFLLQQEMTETGKVVKFPAVVIASDGREVEQDVVRVGGFNIVTPGMYLQYTPETGNLSELGRQPQGRFTKTTKRLFEAQSGRVNFGVDPTRGQILATYLDRPGLRERIGQGGLIGYVIIALGIIGLLISFERLISLSLSSRKVSAQLKTDTPRSDNPLGRVLQVAEQNQEADVETLELKLGEAVFKETPKLTRTLLFIKIISVVAPLLGLLGTVTGMIVTFQAITLFGTGDPKLMAGGISQALVTTVLGLTVAIPIVLLHTLVSGRSKRILHILQEQSAGIVAERSGGREPEAMQFFFEAYVAIRDFMELGGPVLNAIALTILVMWTLILERILYFRVEHKRLFARERNAWESRQERRSWYAHRVREAMVSRLSLAANGPIPLIKALVALCPLLGLMGTVTGMIEVFDVMAISGTGNARSMAAGVSRATIPTMAGMVGALTGVFAATLLSRTAGREVERLDESLTLDH